MQLFEKLLSKFEVTCVIPRQTIEICVISHDQIKLNDTYYICDQCNKSILSEHFKVWLKKHVSCPHCRFVLHELPQLYINK